VILPLAVVVTLRVTDHHAERDDDLLYYLESDLI
jgi:hypothetical protein